MALQISIVAAKPRAERGRTSKPGFLGGSELFARFQNSLTLSLPQLPSLELLQGLRLKALPYNMINGPLGGLRPLQNGTEAVYHRPGGKKVQKPEQRGLRDYQLHALQDQPKVPMS